MKPNEKQKMVAKIIESHAKFWQTTNDINSPTHFCEIDTDFDAITYDDITYQEIIPNDKAEKIRKMVEDLYIEIKNLR